MSSIANLVYEFPHEWPNDLRLDILGNKEILRMGGDMSPSVQSPF